MKNKSWGKYLLDVYAVFLLIAFVFTHFKIWGAIVWGSYPLILLLKFSPESTIYIITNFGLYGVSVLCIIIQAIFLYYAGNVFQKLFNRLKI